MLRPLVILLLAGAAVAADPATAAASAPILRPSFGWSVPDGAVPDPASPGLPVVEVRPGGTAATLGVEAGDRILSINGKPVRSGDDVRTFLAQAQIGAPVTVEFSRNGQVRSASGALQDRPRPVNLAQELATAKAELARLRAQVQDKAKEPSLVELLQSLQELDRRLPKAAAAFKKQYPNGEFDIRISVVISSDRNAADAIELTNVPAAATATAARSR